MKINVVDDICGSGKTSWAIQKINESANDEKFIYVTPYLNEVDRIINSTQANFLERKPRKEKVLNSAHFKEMVESGNSIVTTHQLFRMMDKETLKMVKNAGYTLIMDEVANVINQAPIGSEKLII